MIRLTDTGGALFEQAWALYLKSFPPQERRNLRRQRRIMSLPEYHFEVITTPNSSLLTPNSLVGFILWWGFDDVRYVEHLATQPAVRGSGWGRRILDDFTARANTPVILEVEHPVDALTRRRVGFYERAGFHFNEQLYAHPSYKRGGDPVPLMLMTYPAPLSPELLNRFLKHHSTIFG